MKSGLLHFQCSECRRHRCGAGFDSGTAEIEEFNNVFCGDGGEVLLMKGGGCGDDYVQRAQIVVANPYMTEKPSLSRRNAC